MSERDDHLAIDERIGLRLPDAPLTRLLGTVSEVLEGDPVAMVLLSGTDTPVPIWFPALPVTLVAGDKVAIEKKQPGWLMITHVLGRSGDLGGGSASFEAIETLGDLLVGTGPGAVDNLPVSGVDGMVLTEDSGQPLGMSWQALGAAPAYSGCLVYRTADQVAIANATDVPVTFPSGSATEAWDDGGYHSLASNTSRVIPTVAGKHRIQAGVRFTGANTGVRSAFLRINGTLGIAYSRDMAPLSGTASCLTVAGSYEFNGTTDYVELVARQNSGGTLDLPFEDREIFIMVAADH